ncbi:MAG: hypothetical protein ACMUEL_07190 [Flavobacteriales bacterium Tduv]
MIGRCLNLSVSKLGYKTREEYAEKGYQPPANVFYFHSRGIKDLIYKKVYRNRSLSRIAVLFNKLVNKPRMGRRFYFSQYKALV